MSWLDHIEDLVNDLLTALERIAVATERIATVAEQAAEDEAGEG